MAAALRGGRGLASVAGLVTADREPGEPAAPPTTLWPRADYSLLDVERHFESRGGRRLDYCSSRGARDGPSWTGIRAERVVAEARELAERYRLSEVLFQDEDFFADAERVDAIARGLLDGGGTLHWQARARPEDVVAAGAERLRLVAESGCRRLHVGVRAGPAAPRAPDGGGRASARGWPGGAVRLRGGRARRPCRHPQGRRLGGPVPVRPGRALRDADPPGAGPARGRRRVARGLGRARRVAVVGSPRGAPAGPRDVLLRRGPARPRAAGWDRHLVRLLALVRVRLGFFALDLDRRAVEVSAVLRTGRARPDPHGD